MPVTASIKPLRAYHTYGREQKKSATINDSGIRCRGTPLLAEMERFELSLRFCRTTAFREIRHISLYVPVRIKITRFVSNILAC